MALTPECFFLVSAVLLHGLIVAHIVWLVYQIGVQRGMLEAERKAAKP